MMAVAATPAPPPPVEKPVPAPVPVTTVEKKQPAAAPTPSQSSAMAAAAPTTTGKVTAIGDAEPKKSGAGSMILVILLILGVAGAVAYMKFLKPQTTHVTVALASPREVVRLYDGSGVVKKGDSQALSFGESGKVTDVVAKGTEVKPGMPLATLESYGAIEKQLADVKDRLKYYEGKLEASKAKNDEAGVKTDESKVAEKKKLMADLEARAAKVRLVAPGTGTVTEVLVTAGGEAKAGEPAVKMGGKGMSADFKAEGPKPGEAVQVQTAAGGAPIAGKVTIAANGNVTVELPDDAPLKAGDQLRLVKKKEQNVIPVPTSALTQRDGADVVFVLSDGEVHSRKVTVTDKTPTEVFISSGLANGESVITSDAASLQEGQKASSQ
jgi:multidrug resistance efflux pump